ncbi:Protein of unknown function [Allopseudospirillum japonicum]|uniref:DUF3450 domain-containing protein n=1 Tax=Allopseudospirillum japonicum TaxID=64971 RepID=A0A1H6TVI3_9GAMM|nr:DUF3450 domain-containing protein [Allopseudospirillum japonicum]SEI83226.1 Protein of unknown function [Allopseudospirillum japonicum]
MKIQVRIRAVVSLTFSLGLGWAGLVQAENAAIQQIEQVLLESHRQGAQVQQQITHLDQEAEAAYRQYQQHLQHIRQLTTYNQQVERMLIQQEAEIAQTQQQLAVVEKMQAAALPLLVDMYQALHDFVAQDMPFLHQRRLQALAALGQQLDDAQLSLADKYRHLLEAYQTEIQYGHEFVAWQGQILDAQQTPQQVRFLRVGRVGWFYQNLTATQGTRWHAEQQIWQPLNPQDQALLSKGLSMADENMLPDLLTLPLFMPQLAQGEKVHE